MLAALFTGCVLPSEPGPTDIAVANGGDIRADLPSGVVTKGDIVSVLPFGNTLMVKTVTPALLREALEKGVSGIVLDTSGAIDYESESIKMKGVKRFLSFGALIFTFATL